MLKICKNCGAEKNIFEFYSGRSICKDCKNAAARKKYVDDPETTQRNLVRMRERTKERRYGLTQIEFDKMLVDQNNRCKICSSEFISTKHTHIDHCHDTNRVRGLLCNNCNLALGQFNDNTDNMDNAIKYLNRY